MYIKVDELVRQFLTKPSRRMADREQDLKKGQALMNVFKASGQVSRTEAALSALIQEK